MKTNIKYYVAAIDSITNDVIAISPKFINKDFVERKYGAICVMLMLSANRVLDSLEAVEFEIMETPINKQEK